MQQGTKRHSHSGPDTDWLKVMCPPLSSNAEVSEKLRVKEDIVSEPMGRRKEEIPKGIFA